MRLDFRVLKTQTFMYTIISLCFVFFIVTDAGELCQNVVYLFSELKRNTDDIQELRNKIMEVLRQEPYMGEKIPVR